MKALILSACFFIVSHTSKAQLPILYYDFENNATRTTFENLVEQSVNTGNTAITNVGTSAITGASGAGLFYTGGVANGEAISANTWATTASDPGTSASTYFQFTANTSGFSGLSLEFDCNVTNLNIVGIGIVIGPRKVGILYSTDGGTTFFATSTQSTGTQNAWNHLSFDLSSITAINNKSSVIIRMYGYDTQTILVFSEPMSIDNLQLNALSTVSDAGTKTMLNEPNIYSSITSGGTGSVIERQNFTVTGNSTTVNMGQETFSGSGTSAGNLTVQDTAILNITSPVTIDSAIVANATPLSTLNITSYATVNLSANLLCKGSSTVANTGTFNCGTNTVTNAGVFTVSSGSTLGIGSTAGISSSGSTGNVQTTTRSFSTGGNYTYNGSANQITGSGLPATINNFIINNSADSISLTNNLTVSSQTTLTAGSLVIGSKTLTLNGAVSRVSGNFDGTENSSLVLGGSSAQDIGFDANDTLSLLTINKSSGAATLNSALNIFTGIVFSLANLGTLDLNNKHVTLKSNAISTAYLGKIRGSFNNATNVSVERYIPAPRAWRLLTAPLTNSNSIYNSWQNAGVYTAGQGTLITMLNPIAGSGMDSGINTNYSMKYFNPATQGLVNITNTMSRKISPGTNGSADNIGYFIFVRGDRNTGTIGNPNYWPMPWLNTTLSSLGTLQTGNQLFPTDTIGGGFTLIGNPYASPIDFNNVTLNNVINRFYVWDPTLNQVGGYVVLDDALGTGTFTKSVSASAQTNVLQSGQAFFVQTLSTGAASFTVSESSKSTTNNNLVFRPTSTSASITGNLYLLNGDTSTTYIDGAIAQFDNTFNKAVDWKDALKLGNVNEGIGFMAGTTDLSIDRRPLISNNDTLSLSLTTLTTNNYKIQFNPNNIQQPGLTGKIVDNYLHTSIPLNINDTTTINFSVTTIAASAASNRFMIVFNPAVVLPETFTNVEAYKLIDNVMVAWKVANELNIAQYVVEKSADGKNFTTANITTPTGNQNSTVAYYWLDTKPFAAENYYRIKSIDQSGAITYSQVVMIAGTNQDDNTAVVYPNPIVNGLMELHLSNQPSGNYDISLTNQLGQTSFTQTIAHQQNQQTETVSLPDDISKGIYQLEIIDSNGQEITNKISIQ